MVNLWGGLPQPGRPVTRPLTWADATGLDRIITVRKLDGPSCSVACSPTASPDPGLPSRACCAEAIWTSADVLLVGESAAYRVAVHRPVSEQPAPSTRSGLGVHQAQPARIPTSPCALAQPFHRRSVRREWLCGPIASVIVAEA